MPKKLIVYVCEYCGIISPNEKYIESHENFCYMNQNVEKAKWEIRDAKGFSRFEHPKLVKRVSMGHFSSCDCVSCASLVMDISKKE